MAAKKAPSKVRSKTPSRVKRAKTKRRPRGTGHPELVGLGLLAVGLFLSTVLLFGWDGGVVGEKLDGWLETGIGGARVVLPVVLVGVGALMVARSSLIDLRPFRTGLAVFSLGLLIVLGSERGEIG